MVISRTIGMRVLKVGAVLLALYVLFALVMTVIAFWSGPAQGHGCIFRPNAVALCPSSGTHQASFWPPPPAVVVALITVAVLLWRMARTRDRRAWRDGVLYGAFALIVMSISLATGQLAPWFPLWLLGSLVVAIRQSRRRRRTWAPLR